MYLSPRAIAQYDRDGFILVPGLFSEREVAAMLHDVETGDKVAGLSRSADDASGRASKLALWWDLKDDVWEAASVCPRIVNNLRMLMREEITFYHGKVMLKEARSGGAWEWQQDYGYWYGGFVFPRLISAFVALDPATKENGCLQVLRGSHLLGRLEHGMVGNQVGANEARIADILPLFERVQVEMTPGSVLFFHCNLLHSSAPNESDRSRRSFIMCYNALDNPQIGSNSVDRPVCPVGSDDGILRFATTA